MSIVCIYETEGGGAIEYSQDEAKRTVAMIDRLRLQDIRNTMRGIFTIAALLGFTENEFIDELTGEVLDMGSGFGGLAIAASARGLVSNFGESNKTPLCVWSANPSFASKDVRLEPKGCMSVNRSGELGKLNEKEWSRGIQVHDLYSIPVVSYDLSVFPLNFFHTIIDCMAMFNFMTVTDEEFRTSIQEYLRVLEPGGKAIMGPYYPCDYRGADAMTRERQHKMVREIAHDSGANYHIKQGPTQYSSLILQKPSENS